MLRTADLYFARWLSKSDPPDRSISLALPGGEGVRWSVLLSHMHSVGLLRGLLTEPRFMYHVLPVLICFFIMKLLKVYVVIFKGAARPRNDNGS